MLKSFGVWWLPLVVLTAPSVSLSLLWLVLMTEVLVQMPLNVRLTDL